MTLVRITSIDRPVRPAPDHSWTHRRTQEELDAEARWIAEHKALREEFRAQCELPPPPPADPESPEHFEADAIEWAAFEVWLLRRQGQVAAATKPFWVNHVESLWLTDMSDNGAGLFDREKTAATITLPLVMPGGEFAITYESYKEHCDIEPGKIKTRIGSKKRLKVVTKEGLYSGELQHDCGEMSVELVVLPGNTSQDVADRVAAAYGRIITDRELKLPDDYPIVMPLRPNCTICSKPFTDLISKTLGIGPVCAKRLGVAHSAAAANHILAKRAAYFSEALS